MRCLLGGSGVIGGSLGVRGDTIEYVWVTRSRQKNSVHSGTGVGMLKLNPRTAEMWNYLSVVFMGRTYHFCNGAKSPRTNTLDESLFP